MALTHVAGDDMDEMLQEEAEDVFHEDGRLEAGGQLFPHSCKKELLISWNAHK